MWKAELFPLPTYAASEAQEWHRPCCLCNQKHHLVWLVIIHSNSWGEGQFSKIQKDLVSSANLLPVCALVQWLNHIEIHAQVNVVVYMIKQLLKPIPKYETQCHPLKPSSWLVATAHSLAFLNEWVSGRATATAAFSLHSQSGQACGLGSEKESKGWEQQGRERPINGSHLNSRSPKHWASTEN